MKSVTVNYYGVSGTGRNVTEAKQDAGRKISRVMRHRSPTIYSWRGFSVVIWTETEGLAYTLSYPDSDGRLYSTCFTGDDDPHSGLRHLLDSARQPGEFELPEWCPSDLGRDVISDWHRHDAFQAAYRAAEENGEDNPHQWACENCERFAA